MVRVNRNQPITVSCCYYIQLNENIPTTYFLPLVNLKAHAKIYSTASSTQLTQEFVNPSKQPLEEVKYTFPLYDGVSVGAFTCTIGERVITGLVKERDQARKTYNEAKARGETAGLLEQLPQASDVFTTSIGNIPPNEKVIVNITYVGELKNDAEVDGIRYSIPTRIAPRYGSEPGEVMSGSSVDPGDIQITADVEMDAGCAIKKLQSPSHPISVSVGTVSTAPSAEPSLSKGSATLALGSTELDKDFVLQIVAKDTGIPRAILETHPSIPNSRALMATLVPKFSLKAERPEIIFVADRSGSMESCMQTLVAAMRVFLKSLPVGVRFNICSFGSKYEFLWGSSKAYSQKTLEQAMAYVDSFSADFGGTETYNAVDHAIKTRLKDLSTEIMLLTDGDIWDQQRLFDLVNRKVAESKGRLRLFSIGIGDGVSHSLVEGVARAGHGFAQTVNNGERMEGKLVRMLKGALTPHVQDYSLEVKYADGSDDSDFEIIEKVSDSLSVDLTLSDKGEEDKPKEAKPISLFDESVDMDVDGADQGRYAHLPAISTPKLLQAPHTIPPLFPFNRTTVYLLMSPETSQLRPVSVLLKGKSEQGPLELEIPVQALAEPGKTIHQLATKKATQELEEGRGWIHDARDRNGKLIKETYPSRFDEVIEREAVRLGVKFQVGGKWTSFVAVQANDQLLTANNQSRSDQRKEDDLDMTDDDMESEWFGDASPVAQGRSTQYYSPPLAMQSPRATARKRCMIQGVSMASQAPQPGAEACAFAQATDGLFAVSDDQCDALDAVSSASIHVPSAAPAKARMAATGVFGRLTGMASPAAHLRKRTKIQAPRPGAPAAPPPAPPAPSRAAKPSTLPDVVAALIHAQHFDGRWPLACLPGILPHTTPAALEAALEALAAGLAGAEATQPKLAARLRDVLATAVAVLFLERGAPGEHDVWELVADKARAWLRAECRGQGEEERVWAAAAAQVPSVPPSFGA